MKYCLICEILLSCKHYRTYLRSLNVKACVISAAVIGKPYPGFCSIKVAPYSFTIACALKTKAQVICARSKENVNVFRYFMTSTRAQKAKLAVYFLVSPSVKFWKTWQTGSNLNVLL